MISSEQNADVSFLVGKTIDGVLVGEYQVQIILSDATSIDLESEFALNGQRAGRNEYEILKHIKGQTVTSVTPFNGDKLSLTLGSGQELELFASNLGYESFSIRGPSRFVVV